MCFYAKKLKIKKAWRNITVWKIIQLDNKSLYIHFKYEYNKSYFERLRISSPGIYHPYFEINEGFHSYWNKLIARNMMHCTDSNYKIQKFIIPKGALYAVNEDKEVVSNQIKMVK